MFSFYTAKKYKQYNQVRDILSGKSQPQALPTKDKVPSKSRKRRSDEGIALAETPSKRSRPAQTPSKPRQYDAEDGDGEQEAFETPSARKLFSPPMPTSIGPTPQKDGRVLGLFDLLDEEEENAHLKDQSHHVQVQATPSKKSAAIGNIHDDDEIENVKLGRTPMSTSKRAMLDTFMTPLKPRDGNSGAGAGGKTHMSVSKLQLFSTPSFLRRAPLPPIGEDDGSYKSPRPLRLPRKPLGRSLSSVVASLRKLEEEKLDEDLEALHEMENDNAAPSAPPKPKASNDHGKDDNDNDNDKPEKPAAAAAEDEILEPDSQAPKLLGGFDDEGMYDSPTEEELGRDGQPLRVYKKKGQKRTTRRVNMRPTRTKRPQTEDGGNGDAEEEDATVPETQFDAATKLDNSDPLDLGSDSDFEDVEDEGGDGAKKKAASKKGKGGGQDAKKGEEGGNKIKKAARKVNALAHTNFKRLKLRNHGSKGGPGFNSRFRRRR